MFTPLRFLRPALVSFLIATIVTGIAYPLLITAIAAAEPETSQGQMMVSAGGRIEGSRLLAQDFSRRRDLFHARPSAVDYDPTSSGGSQLGPSNPELARLVAARRARVAATENVAPSAVPADAVTASASGLDPDISPAYAALQVPRVAKASGLSVAQVRSAVERHTHHALLGFLTSDTVNVVTLNADILALRRARS